MEAILPTRKMVVEADKASSVDGGLIKDVEDQVVGEVGTLAKVVVVKVLIQTSRHNISNKMPTSMTSKFLQEIIIKGVAS